MGRDLGLEVQRELTRRQVLGGVLGLAAIPIFGYSPRANAQAPSVSEIVSYHTHQHLYGRKGIDFQKGHGEPVTAPIDGHVYLSGTLQEGGTAIFIETDLGFLVDMAGFSEIGVQPGMRVGSLDIIGKEGKNTKRGRMEGGSVTLTDDADVHTHVGILPPWFAERFRSFPYARTDPYNNKKYLVDNPDEHSANKQSLLTSVYQGDNSANEKLLAKAQRNLLEIAERNPDSFLAWYIRNSADERIFPSGAVRFFPRTLVAAIAAEPGNEALIETPKLREDVMRYLEWHVNAYRTEPGAGLFLPYVNPALKDRYKVVAPDGGRVEKIAKKQDEIVQLYQQKRWREMIQVIRESRAIAQLGVFPKGGAESGTERNLGIGHAHLNEDVNAVVHGLTALGLSTHEKLEGAGEERTFFQGVYWTLNHANRRLGNIKQADFFKAKYSEVLRGNR